MIKLTAPNGTEVEVNSTAITSMYPNDGTYDKRAKTVLVVAGQHQAVVETIAEIKAMTLS
jgi:uncharacterized protein YlzI (FlbEa/FlbD family)